MPEVRGVRPRTLSAVFGTYFLVVIVVAFIAADPVAVYVMPSATFWISAAYVLLGAVALVGICAGALVRAGHLEDRIVELNALRDRVGREIPGVAVRTAPEARELERLSEVRDAVAITVFGPAVAAIGVIGGFAPVLPAADGMLLSDLRLNAFLGLAGVGCLVGVAAYGLLAFRQLRFRARA